MSRYHNIHCRIWNDDKFPFTSDDCQLVFFHLLTSPMSTQFGLFKASIPALAAEKRWPEKRYAKAFREAFAKGFIKHDERHQVILIPRFLKYNKPNNPNVLISWGKAYSELPDCELKEEFYQYFKGFLEDFGEAFQKAFNKAFVKPIGKVLVYATATDTVSVKEGVQGEIKQKDTSPKSPDFVFLIPEWIDPGIWEEYLVMRKSKKNVPTEYAKHLVMIELDKLRKQGENVSEVLNQSIRRKWVDVYAVKKDAKEIEPQSRDASGRALKYV